MSTKIIEVTGTQPLVTVDEDVSNVSVVNQPINVTVESAVAVGNTTIRNAFGAIDPIWYDKEAGVFGFIDRSEVVRSEKMVDASATPIYGGDSPEGQSVVSLDSEKYDIFTIRIAGPITDFDFGNIASGQTVTIICEQSDTPGELDESSGAWSNWFWTNNNNTFPGTSGDVFIIKVLWTGNTYYASLLEFDTVMPETQVGIPVGPDEPENPEPGWLWYDTVNSLLMIYVDGAWVVAGGGGGANVSVGDESPSPAEEGDLWFDTGQAPPTLKVYYDGVWYNSEGLQGPRGYTGSQGERGAQGYTGSAGREGYTGSQGAQGDRGFTGSASTEQGPVGFTGSAGRDGYTGSRGDIGYTGSASTVAGPVGFTGSQGTVGFTGSKGDAGFTGSASTVPGYTGSQGFTGSQGIQGSTGNTGFVGSKGFDGSKGDLGYTGSQGFTGSKGFDGSQGAVGFTGSKGLDGQGVIQEEPPQDANGGPEIQWARVHKFGAADGDWEAIEASSEWDGILYDKPAVIDHATSEGNALTDDYSGITIGKNGYLNTTLTQLPQLNPQQKNNLVIGRNAYINGADLQNITALGSGLTIEEDILPYGNTDGTILGNFDTKHYYLGKTLGVSESSIDRYGGELPVIKIEPLSPVFLHNGEARNLVITSKNGSIILNNDYNASELDQMLRINSNRVRYKRSLNPDGIPSNQIIRREIYADSTNFFSDSSKVLSTATESEEFSQRFLTWRSRRNINYFSPERIRFRKFAECVNQQTPGIDIEDYPDQTYAGPNLDIDINRGTIHHKILIDDVSSIDITDVEWSDPDIGRAQSGYVDYSIEPGTSMTIILYHQTALRTISWPTTFMFLGGENTLSTEPSNLLTVNINNESFDNIQAIDMLNAFYDGTTWWCSITKGYTNV